MNWEHTDSVKAETAKDSSSKVPWATAPGLLLGESGVELLSQQVQVGSRREVTEDANQSPGDGPQPPALGPVL